MLTRSAHLLDCLARQLEPRAAVPDYAHHRVAAAPELPAELVAVFKPAGVTESNPRALRRTAWRVPRACSGVGCARAAACSCAAGVVARQRRCHLPQARLSAGLPAPRGQQPGQAAGRALDPGPSVAAPWHLVRVHGANLLCGSAGALLRLSALPNCVSRHRNMSESLARPSKHYGPEASVPKIRNACCFGRTQRP